MIKTYVKRPVEVQAVQWTGDNMAEMFKFIGESCDVTKDFTPKLIIHTLEGDHTARVGDYIIRGVKGEFYPCKPDIFEETYEEVCCTSFNKPTYNNVERCVCCGHIIPEGRMICWNCEHLYFEDDDDSGLLEDD